MDIWAWFHRAVRDIRDAGHHDVADKFSRFSNMVSRHEHDAVDAAYPELLAASRAMGNGWLEVFVRHWHAQSLYLRNHSSALLKEAVTTLEFAHRDDTRDCPQSVCAVQDLCMAYASLDGPAFVDERLGVTAEAFARIDGTWPCYVCLAAEEAAAYVDAGRLDEALVTVRRRVGVVNAAKGRLDGHDATVLAQWVAAAGDAAEALRMLAPTKQRDDSGFEAEQAIVRAQSHLALGDAEAAERAMPTAEAAIDGDEYWRWILAHDALVAAGVRDNGWAEGARIHSFVAELVQHGASWRGFRLAQCALRLAVARSARCSAEAALQLMRGAQAGLDDPARVADQVSEAEASVGSIPAPTLPCAPAEVAAVLDADTVHTPEELLDLAAIAVAHGALGDDLLVVRARLMADLGRMVEARALLLHRLELAPESVELAVGCLRTFWNDAPSLQRVAEILAVAQPMRSAWALANLAFRRNDHAAVGRHCQVILDIDPTAVNTARLWADACRAGGQYVHELELRRRVLEHSDPVDPMDRWQLLVPATICGEWDAVREQLPFLDLHPDSIEGAIDEHWGHVLITYSDGRAADIVAQRTGPVSARICGVLAWDDEQLYGDEVVFEPGYLNEQPDDADQPGSTWRPVFRHVVTVRPGGYRTEPVTGPYPGDEVWESVRSKLGECDLIRVSGADYQLFDQQRHHKVPAVFAQLLIPPTVSLVEADAMLHAATAELADPLFWWELADDAGLDPAVHRERGKRYGHKYPAP